MALEHEVENPESLEEVLRKVEVLRWQLGTTIKLDTGHMGYARSFHTEERGVPGTDEKKVWIPDRIPDMQTRKAAERELYEIEDNCPWYSGRYAAHISLYKPTLGKKYNANSPLFRPFFQELEKELASFNTETRLKAVNDLGGFFGPFVQHSNAVWKAMEILERAYKHNSDKETRIAAGKAFGYSSLRIWSHELVYNRYLYPIRIPLMGIAFVGGVAGVALGVGYIIEQFNMLIQYLSK